MIQNEVNMTDRARTEIILTVALKVGKKKHQVSITRLLHRSDF